MIIISMLKTENTEWYKQYLSEDYNLLLRVHIYQSLYASHSILLLKSCRTSKSDLYILLQADKFNVWTCPQNRFSSKLPIDLVGVWRYSFINKSERSHVCCGKNTRTTKWCAVEWLTPGHTVWPGCSPALPNTSDQYERISYPYAICPGAYWDVSGFFNIRETSWKGKNDEHAVMLW